MTPDQTIEDKTHYKDLTPEEIDWLKSEAWRLNLRQDLVDVDDRLDLIQCLFYWVEEYKKNKKPKWCVCESGQGN